MKPLSKSQTIGQQARQKRTTRSCNSHLMGWMTPDELDDTGDDESQEGQDKSFDLGGDEIIVLLKGIDDLLEKRTDEGDHKISKQMPKAKQKALTKKMRGPREGERGRGDP